MLFLIFLLQQPFTPHGHQQYSTQRITTTTQDTMSIEFNTFQRRRQNDNIMIDRDQYRDLSNIVSFVAADAGKNNDISNGDTLTIMFAHPMAEPKPAIATKEEIDSVFNFSSSIGSDYSGKWTTPSIAVITLLNVRNDSLPTLSFTWDYGGTVRYNGTSQTVDTDMSGQENSRIKKELSIGDYIRIEGQPENGVEILYFNQSSTIGGGTLLITRNPIVINDPESFKVKRPITTVLTYANLEKRRLIGIVPPPYSSPRFMTEIGRLTVSVNYVYTTQTHKLTLDRWRVGNETRLPTWERKRMVASLTGTYGRPQITPADPGTVIMNLTSGTNTTVNATNATYYQLSLSGNEVNSGCFASDSMYMPQNGITTNDTVHLIFGNRTSAPASPIHLDIHVASYNVALHVPTWYAAAGLPNDNNNTNITRSIMKNMASMVAAGADQANDAEKEASATNTSVLYSNMTVNGIDLVNSLCRFYLIFTMGDVEVITNTTLSVLDGADVVRHSLENIPTFGNSSIRSIQKTMTGWSIDFTTSCPFCRGPLLVQVVPAFFHPVISLNGTLLDNVTHTTTTNHYVVLYNQTCPMIKSPPLIIAATTATTVAAGNTDNTENGNTAIDGSQRRERRSLTHYPIRSRTTITDLSLSAHMNPDGQLVTDSLLRSLFEFSSPLSTAMIGSWKSSRHLQITLLNVDSKTINVKMTGVGRMKNPKRQGKLTVRIKETDEKLFSKGDHFHIRPEVSNMPCVLDGTWGEHERVKVVEVRASDLNDPPLQGFSANDALSLTFNVPTNMPPAVTKEEINAWLIFGGFINTGGNVRLYRCPLQCLFPGTEYTGEWIDSQHLLITIHDATLEEISGTGPDGDEIPYKHIEGVSLSKQIRILSKKEVEDGVEGGFAVFALEDGPLATMDDSSPPCKMLGEKLEYCGQLAVGDWGYTADLTSVATVLYTICCVYFFGSLLLKLVMWVNESIFG